MKRRTTTDAARILRRSLAFFLGTIGFWLLSLTADFTATAHALLSLGESPAFVAAALESELGPLPEGEGPLQTLDRWQRLALSQSYLLRAGEEAVALYRAGGETLLPDTPLPVEPTEPDDPEDTHQLPEVASAPEGIVEQTISVTDGGAYERAGNVYLHNRTEKTLDMAALASAPVQITLDASGPEVLIMHTHGSEAYAPDGSDAYQESDTARTTDPNYNVIRVGDEMEQVFTQMGLNVLHDRTLYDYPAYSGSYERSKAAVERYLAEYPTIKVVLDIHRDALIDADGTIYKAVTTIDGVKAAQILLIVGSDEGGAAHPQWQENLTLGIKIQQTMNTLWPSLARPIALRSTRYNQQLTTGSLLVEVGCHGNTLAEALAGARLFARAAGQVLLSLK